MEENAFEIIIRISFLFLIRTIGITPMHFKYIIPMGIMGIHTKSAQWPFGWNMSITHGSAKIMVKGSMHSTVEQDHRDSTNYMATLIALQH